MIQENVAQILQNISSICAKLGRDPKSVTLIGVTKTADVSKIKEAIDAGIAHIGENKVQEGQNKFPSLEQLTGKKVTKHLIGHLQTNKAKHALKFFDLIQSVDSFKLAEEIDKQAEKLGRSADILVQIKTSGEEQKFGAGPSEALELIEQISQLKNIRILGLMTMAPFTEDETQIRPCFQALREIRDQAQKKFAGQEKVQMKYLSMGMTDDYKIALEEGSNMVRIGRAIFKE